jgi:hypothetical protein
MTLKNLFMLGGVIAGAAYLKDQSRRERLFGQARGFLDKAKAKVEEMRGTRDLDDGIQVAPASADAHTSHLNTARTY